MRLLKIFIGLFLQVVVVIFFTSNTVFASSISEKNFQSDNNLLNKRINISEFLQFGDLIAQENSSTPLKNGSCDILQISSNEKNVCVITLKNELYCLGDNSYGQLGNGTYADKTELTKVEDNVESGFINNKIIQVSVGLNHVCAIRGENSSAERGTVYCWGSNESGQLGINACSGSYSKPMLVSDGIEGFNNGNVTKVSAGVDETCFIDFVGTHKKLFCSGRYLVDPPTPTPTPTITPNPPVTVTATATVTATVTETATATATVTETVTATVTATVTEVVTETVTATATVTATVTETVTATTTATVTETVTATVTAFPSDSPSSAPTTTQSENPTTSPMDSPTGWDGFSDSFNPNLFPSLGLIEEFACEPIAVLPEKDVLDVSVGAHICVVDIDKKLYCFGKNNKGQLGIGNNEDKAVPTLVYDGAPEKGTLGGLGVDRVSAGSQHTCAINEAKELYCWGNNNPYGELGDNSTIDRNIPMPVDEDGSFSGKLGGLGVLSVSINGNQSCATNENKEVYCWGKLFEKIPIKVENNIHPDFKNNNIRSVSVGGGHFCVIMGDVTESLSTRGRVFCWGYEPFNGEKEVDDCSCKKNQHLIGTQCSAESEDAVCKDNWQLFCNSEEGELECRPVSTTEICNKYDDDCDGIPDNNDVITISGVCYEDFYISSIKNYNECTPLSILVKEKDGLYCYNYRNDEDFNTAIKLPNKISEFKKIQPSPPTITVKSDEMTITMQEYRISSKLRNNVLKEVKKYKLQNVKLYYMFEINREPVGDVVTNGGDEVLGGSVKIASIMSELSSKKDNHGKKIRKRINQIKSKYCRSGSSCTVKSSIAIGGNVGGRTQVVVESQPSKKAYVRIPPK